MINTSVLGKKYYLRNGKQCLFLETFSQITWFCLYFSVFNKARQNHPGGEEREINRDKSVEKREKGRRRERGRTERMRWIVKKGKEAEGQRETEKEKEKEE